MLERLTNATTIGCLLGRHDWKRVTSKGSNSVFIADVCQRCGQEKVMSRRRVISGVAGGGNSDEDNSNYNSNENSDNLPYCPNCGHEEEKRCSGDVCQKCKEEYLKEP